MADPTLLEIKITENASFRLILVEGGSFNMGSDNHESEQPIHSVTLPSFYLAEYPVTQALWLAVTGGENPSTFPGLQRPVESISWFDAAAFCNHLSLYCGYAPVYFSDPAFQKSINLEKTQKIEHPNAIPIFPNPAANGFRLPSEAEWEYAARGGNKSEGFRYAGGDKLDELGWYDDNSHGETKPVGLKLSNELGIYDLSGNILEWCADHWHDNYQGAPNDGSAWVDVEEEERIQRGGSWLNSPVECRPFDRYTSYEAAGAFDIGFRVALGFPSGS